MSPAMTSAARTLAGACLLLAASATAARAQTQADSAGIVSALVHTIASERDSAEAWVEEGPTPFDSAATAALRRAPRFRRAVADSAHARVLRTDGFTVSGDTATVTVEMRRCVPRDESLNYWRARMAYEFVRSGAEWRFVRGREVASADGHCGPDVEGG